MQAQNFAAIINAVNLYAVAVDMQQWALYDRVFTDDAATDFWWACDFFGIGNDQGSIRRDSRTVLSTMHVTTNRHVAVSDSTATCLSYVHGRFLRDPGEGGNMFESTGWYDDLQVRIDGNWRIQGRSCRTVWWGGNPLVLQTTPDVHVEPALNSLRTDAQAGSLGHLSRLASGT